MTLKKNAVDTTVQAELCPNATRTQAQRDAIDQMYAMQAIARGLVSGLKAYQELVLIEQRHQLYTELSTEKPCKSLKPRSELTECYHLEDLAEAFAHLVLQQDNALHVIGGGE